MMETIGILKKIINNVEKVIIGKNEVVELTLIALICEGHVLIEDVPGVGKTALVSSLAKSIDASFNRIQFTPDLLPSDITGFSMFNQKTGEFEYRSGAIMAQMLLADEINRTSPKTQSSLLEAMEENQVTVDGITYPVPKPFIVLATQNPIEYLGTYPLPEAQMDRFFIRISLGYPSPAVERDILTKYQFGNPLDNLDSVATSDDIIKIQGKVRDIYVSDSIKNYIVEIVNKTRTHNDVLLGSSPRGSMALYRASQAWALYNNRDYCCPDDVKKMAIPVLAHRISLKHNSKIKKINSESIIKEIIETVNVPVVENNAKK
jgi:MoxR-like ATPase